MRIQTVGAGPHPDFSKVGCVVTIAGVSIDCAERQTDSAEIIDLRDVDGSGRVVEGGERVSGCEYPHSSQGLWGCGL